MAFINPKSSIVWVVCCVKNFILFNFCFALFVFISCTKSTDSDKNLVEVFANNKQAVAVEHQYIRKNPNLRIFTNDNDLTISKVQAWKMGNMYK